MSSPPSIDVLSTANFTITLLPASLSVGRILPNGVQSCAFPLLKAMFSGGDGSDDMPEWSGFFSLTQEADELTLLMDERCRAAFDECAAAAVEYAPHRWRAFELHLGSLAWEVPGLVCFLATLMAESGISILNLSANDRDFLLVQESDVAPATTVIQERLQHDVVGLRDAISEKALVRRSGTFSSFSGAKSGDELLAILEEDERRESAAATGDAAHNGGTGSSGGTRMPNAKGPGGGSGPGSPAVGPATIEYADGRFRLPRRALSGDDLEGDQKGGELFVRGASSAIHVPSTCPSHPHACVHPHAHAIHLRLAASHARPWCTPIYGSSPTNNTGSRPAATVDAPGFSTRAGAL